MTQEQKELLDSQKDLLLKDLSARVPYGVKVLYNNQVKELQYIEAVYNEVKLLDYTMNYTVGIDDIKPYLFPLSSMTKEQEREWQSLMVCDIYGVLYHTIESFDYLYKNHIDIRCLIPMGLAKDATGLNIY